MFPIDLNPSWWPQVQHAAAFFQAGAFAALKGDGAWDCDCLGLGKWCVDIYKYGVHISLRDKVFEAILQGQIWKKISMNPKLETPSLTNVILRIVKGDPIFINKKVLLSLYELIGFSFTNKSV